MLNKCLLMGLIGCITMAVTSCDMMHEDTDDCPYGVYVKFKYDYNLQRADMFNDHVGAVTLYVFDEDGKLVKTQTEKNNTGYEPLKSTDYTMHITDLEPGNYRFIALAGQCDYSDMLNTNRAKFVRSDMAVGSSMENLDIQLDRTSAGDGTYNVVNNGLPLDTLWHGMDMTGIDVVSTRPSYDTISLVRDTKKISITLRELDDPTTMDVANYDMKITDRNSHILYDNSLDESETVVYTPHATWNTEDKTTAENSSGVEQDGVGKIAHADFMTSRLIDHGTDVAQDGRLTITNKTTGVQVVNVNVPDLLSRLRNYEDTHRYSAQEYLDRGYDYQMDFFLKGDKLSYVNISISVLSWSMRIQFEELD